MLAARVLAAAILHIHHVGRFVRKAEGGAGVAGVAIDGVARTALVSAAWGLDVDHALEFMLCAVQCAAVALHSEVGMGLAS